jgi:predicted ester cyclase
MDSHEMEKLFMIHREAEARRDYDAVIDTFAENCYLETVALGTRSVGRTAARAAYVGYFTAFPDLAPADEGMAFGDNVMITWGHLNGTSKGEWLGVAPGGDSFHVPFTNVTEFDDTHMLGERIYFDLATLCEQAGVPLEAIRAAATSRAARPASA